MSEEYQTTSGDIYEGDILDDFPHGVGKIRYVNGNVYEGDFYYGIPDGYGKYTYANSTVYTGYMSYGQRHGIGTYETSMYVTKGTWRQGRKHGQFTKTFKEEPATHLEIYRKNKCVFSNKIQYCSIEHLQTTKINPKNRPKKYNHTYRSTNEKKCIVCLVNACNATNPDCGHVVLCYECMLACDKCPICRVPIKYVLKLFSS